MHFVHQLLCWKIVIYFWVTILTTNFKCIWLLKKWARVDIDIVAYMSFSFTTINVHSSWSDNIFKNILNLRNFWYLFLIAHRCIILYSNVKIFLFRVFYSDCWKIILSLFIFGKMNYKNKHARLSDIDWWSMNFCFWDILKMSVIECLTILPILTCGQFLLYCTHNRCMLIWKRREILG